MQAVSVDTDILARAPLGDDLEQQGLAIALLDAASKGPGRVVSAFAVLEMAWVLRSRKIPRRGIVQVIRTLLDAEGVTVTPSEILHRALERFENGKSDLGECLIQADGQAAGAQPFATFDRIPQEEGWGVPPHPPALPTLNHAPR